jgi:dienelactone hydrolase
MSEVVLYHHVQGLTDGVRSFAEELRQAGHTVHTPDLFDGRTFDTIEEGMAYAREAGFAALAERGVAAAEGIKPDVVYAGFSFGVMPAQQLDLAAAQTLVETTDRAELFVYPGEEHLFADSSLPAYDAAAAALLTERVLVFLDQVQA